MSRREGNAVKDALYLCGVCQKSISEKDRNWQDMVSVYPVGKPMEFYHTDCWRSEQIRLREGPKLSEAEVARIRQNITNIANAAIKCGGGLSSTEGEGS